MRVVAVCLSLTLMACFPTNARHRTYAKVTEGTMLAAGIALLAVVNSGADCDQEMGLGVVPDKNCKSNAGALGGLGLGLIIVGMIGFLATVTTTPDDPPPVVTPLPVAPPAPTPPSTTPTPIAQ